MDGEEGRLGQGGEGEADQVARPPAGPAEGTPPLLLALLAAISEQNGLDQSLYPGLRCPEAEHLQETETDIPDFGDKVDVTKGPEGVKFTIIAEERVSSRTSVTSGSREVSGENRYKIRHDFVSEGIQTGGTDRKLSDVFPKLEDVNDDLTPDFIITDHRNVHHVIEVGTLRAGNQWGLRRVFREKKFKYEAALQDRSLTSVITYTPLIVGYNMVCSNIMLPERVIDELLFRMRIGIALEDNALGKGFTITRSEDEETLSIHALSVREEVRGVEFKFVLPGDRVTITEDFYSRVMGVPNVEREAGQYTNCYERAKDDMRTCSSKARAPTDFLSAMAHLEDPRSDQKPVFPIPLIIPLSTRDNIMPRQIPIACSGDHKELKTLWDHVLRQPGAPNSSWKEEDKAKLLEEAYERDPKKVEKLQEERRGRKNLFHRVSLTQILNNNMRRYLARDGVFAKKWRKDTEHKQRMRDQKKPFAWTTDTSDIDKFLDLSDLLLETKGGVPDSTKQVLKCLDLASRLARNSHRCKNLITAWTKTRIFSWLDMISDIGTELATSIKQHTKPEQMILKKLRYWDVYLLISPTNAKSHIFVSLFFPGQNHMEGHEIPVFGKTVKVTHGQMTHFMSFRADKLENLVSASATLISLVAFWAHFYNIIDPDPCEFMLHTEARRMLFLSLLIRLEDKESTELTITNTRFMYMEIFRGGYNICKPDPFKILKKNPKVPRSRLTLWVMKKTIENVSSMLLHPPTKLNPNLSTTLLEGEDALPGDEWVGLTNIFTSAPLVTAGQCVELIYLGYLKNKNQVAQGNNDWKLVEKIIEEEMTLDMNALDVSRGLKDPEGLPDKKQFSLNSLLFGCSLMEERLKRKIGPNWKEVLMKEILEELANKMTHMIATLKASSTLPTKGLKKTVSMKSNVEIHRIKVLEALAVRLNDFGLNPMTRLGFFIQHLEDNSGGAVCDIFDKNQHGGTREIYVLNPDSRVVQLFVETVSRVICSQFEEETLTHPENKLKLIDRHKAKVAKTAKIRDCLYGDFCNSSDKTRWNQNFVMTAMAVPLLRLTDKIFHAPIIRILNLWANKFIKLPPKVCSLLLSKVQLSSRAYQDLLQKFWKPHDPRATRNYIRDQCGSFLNLTTGMMQGILHYSSSLMHLAFLHASGFMMMQTLKSKYPSWKFSITQVCSSDDSATVLSVMSPQGTDKIIRQDLKVIADIECVLRSLSYYCQYFCMRDSEKSTICVYDYVEFNSEFVFKNTVVKPKIKIIAALTTLTESESFVQRFHTQYNLLSDLTADGFPTFYSSIAQIAQLWIHYKALGSSTSGVFGEWVSKILQYPSPMHGFFLLDNELVCGLMGWTFCYWLALDMNLSLGRRFRFIKYTEVEVTEDGAIVQALVIKHGDSKKHLEMLSRVMEGKMESTSSLIKVDKLSGEWRLDRDRKKKLDEELEHNCELLFRHPKTIPELRLKLMMKASMPGVARSLGKGNPFLSAMASSVFSLFTHCFTKTTLELQEAKDGVVKREKKITKVSILSDLHGVLQASPPIDDDEVVDQLLEECFPLHERYKEVLTKICSFQDSTPVKIHRIRQRKSHIIIQPRTTQLPLTLQQVCARLWYGHSCKTTEKVFKRCLNCYRLKYSWLRDTFEETTQSSPFQSSVELYYFISSQSVKPRRFHLTGPGIHSDTFDGQVNQFIRKCHLQAHVLELGVGAQRVISQMREPQVKLSLALTIPHVDTRDEIVRSCLIHDTPSVPSDEHLKSMTPRDFCVAVMSAYLRGHYTLDQVIEAINFSSTGVIISFTHPQEPEVREGKTYWVGPGAATAISSGVVMTLELHNDYITSIRVGDFDKVRQNPYILRDVFQRLGCRATNTTSGQFYAAAVYKDGRLSRVGVPGTPLISDKTLGKFILSPERMVFKVKYGSCGFYCTIRGAQKAVLEFASNVKDFSTVVNHEPVDKIWQAWVEFRPVSWVAALEFIDAACREMKAGRIRPGDQSRMKSWVKMTLPSRLKYKSSGFSVTEFSVALRDMGGVAEPMSEAQMEKIFTDFYEEYMAGEEDGEDDELMNLLTSALSSEKERTRASQGEGSAESATHTLESIAAELETEDDFTELFTNSWYLFQPHQSQIERSEAYNYLHMHPIWDQFIRVVHDSDPTLFNKVLNGVMPTANRELAEKLMFLLDITPQRQEQDILTRMISNLGRATRLDLSAPRPDRDSDGEE